MQQAIALDPVYADAHRWLAEILWAAWTHWGEPMEPSRSMAVAEAETAVALDPNDVGCRWVYGHMLAYQGQWTEADAELAAAVKLDPSHADAWAVLAGLVLLALIQDAVSTRHMPP